MLSLVNPLSSQSKVQKDMLKKEQQVIDSNERSFQPGEKVLCRDENKKQWKEGTLREPKGSIMYEVENKSGTERKHLDLCHITNTGSNIHLVITGKILSTTVWKLHLWKQITKMCIISH